MEAKETVIKDLSVPILNHLDLPMGQAIAIEQAEISFRAGQENEREKHHREILASVDFIRKEELEKSRKVGIKEVVEWADGICEHSPNKNIRRRKCFKCWQSKLKELKCLTI